MFESLHRILGRKTYYDIMCYQLNMYGASFSKFFVLRCRQNDSLHQKCRYRKQFDPDFCNDVTLVVRICSEPFETYRGSKCSPWDSGCRVFFGFTHNRIRIFVEPCLHLRAFGTRATGQYENSLCSSLMRSSFVLFYSQLLCVDPEGVTLAMPSTKQIHNYAYSSHHW